VTRVIWTRQAVEDVEAIKAYVARDSERYAGLLAERLVAAVGRLEWFPHTGRIVPEVGDDSLREVIYGNYQVS
jgi:plasmid stabilization system protein ParE